MNILITGASDGIGKAIAISLSKTGHSVILLGKDKKRLEEASKFVPNSSYVVCDLSDDAAITRTAKNLMKSANIDVLINNAGIWIEGNLETNKPEDIRKVIEINALGHILMTREILPHMKKKKKGTIINIISDAGLNAKPERSVYNASKFAMTGFTKSLELEAKEYGVRVIGIYPGKVNTKLFSKVGIDKDLGNSIMPEDVASLVSYILSVPQSVIITGASIRHS